MLIFIGLVKIVERASLSIRACFDDQQRTSDGGLTAWKPFWQLER